MPSGGVAFRICGNFAAILFISIDGGKTKQCYRNVHWSFFTYINETERGRRRRSVRQEIAVMNTTVLLNQTHPGTSISFEIGELFRVERVAYAASNQNCFLFSH